MQLNRTFKFNNHYNLHNKLQNVRFQLIQMILFCISVNIKIYFIYYQE